MKIKILMGILSLLIVAGAVLVAKNGFVTAQSGVTTCGGANGCQCKSKGISSCGAGSPCRAAGSSCGCAK